MKRYLFNELKAGFTALESEREGKISSCCNVGVFAVLHGAAFSLP